MKYLISKILFTILVMTVQTVSAEKTILAGGCFWCMEADFETLEGVSGVISGFTGGSAINPTYRGDHSGHYEAVEITYDPAVVNYQDILDHFWVNIDPFDDRGQFCDKGHSYLSAIFVASNEQRIVAEKSRQAVIEMFPDQTVVTPVLDEATFYPIKGDESYHQDYYIKSPLKYKYYRWGCGRDKRLKQIWGDRATH